MIRIFISSIIIIKDPQILQSCLPLWWLTDRAANHSRRRGRGLLGSPEEETWSCFCPKLLSPLDPGGLNRRTGETGQLEATRNHTELGPVGTTRSACVATWGWDGGFTVNIHGEPQPLHYSSALFWASILKRCLSKRLRGPDEARAADKARVLVTVSDRYLWWRVRGQGPPPPADCWFCSSGCWPAAWPKKVSLSSAGFCTDQYLH